LHIELEIGGTSHGFELRAPTRFTLPREILQESAPDPNAQITPRHRQYLSHWLAKRVRRTALPTAFDGRVTQETRSQLRDVLRPLSDSIDAILIAMDPDDVDLPPEQPYVVQVVALIAAADYDDAQRRTAVENAMRQIETLLDQCEGIVLDACEVQSTAEMTLEVYVDFNIWDYDELSLIGGGELPHPHP
jgi:hypothetical protein